MLAMGDALAFTLDPKGHERVWSFRREPRWYRQMSAASLAHPSRSLMIAAFELAVGLGLVAASHRLTRHA